MSCHRISANVENPVSCTRSPAPRLMPKRVSENEPASDGSNLTLYPPTPPMMYGLMSGCGPNAYVAFNVTATTRAFSDGEIPLGVSLLPNWCHVPSTRKPSGTSGSPRSTSAPACHPDDATSDSLPTGKVPPPTMPNRAGLEANCADAGTAKASDVTAAITL